jgi:hypothetical protein
MTARRATLTLSRAALTALATVSPAAIICASADPFRVPVCSTATLSIPPPKSVCFSSSRSRGSVQPLDNCLGLIGDDDQLDLHRIWFLGPFQGSKWLTLRARLLLFPFSKKLKCVAQCGVICFLLSTREIREDFHSLLQ